MASKLLSVSVFICIVSMLVVVDGADKVPTPSPVDCSSVILSLADCLPFVTNGSTVSQPTSVCCSGLDHILKTSPNCLCEAFKNSAKFNIPLNLTKALTLPSACKLTAPPLSDCGLSPTSAPSPSPAHSNSTPSTPSASPKPSPPSSPSAPAAAPGAADEHSHPSTPSSEGKNSASALFPISAASILLCLLAATFSGF